MLCMIIVGCMSETELASTKVQETVHTSITTKSECIDFLKKQTKESVTWFKRQYADVCSSGDVYINSILDMLRQKLESDELSQLEWKDIVDLDDSVDDERRIYFIEHINGFYELFLNGEKPDPWWAS
ncbi:hypothetical protein YASMINEVIRUS_601 [Yasminevirus sp. GU-2018]|uniref:Uncharacterized protein n=1 Tax=Yasminevirus sp. GU-2018 TaxID=2420051 RepID=A0A5K0U7Z7_9VIRU|nr:hypothetical protein YASMINEVIRUS_601 [Yasminevirus sp. GU-2018]